MIVPTPFAEYYAEQEPCDLAEVGEKCFSRKHLDMALLLRTFKVSFTNLECKPNYVIFVLIFFADNSNVVKNNLCRINALID